MSYKSYYNQQEPLNKNPLNQSKSAKMEIPKKSKKNPKKPVPNLKFAVAFGFFWLQLPQGENGEVENGLVRSGEAEKGTLIS